MKRHNGKTVDTDGETDPTSVDNITGKTETNTIGMWLFGPSKDPVKYTSSPTRATSLQNFMNGAEFNEYQSKLSRRTDEIPENLAVRFQSNTVYRDIPSCYPGRLTIKKIANRTFNPETEARSWKRNKGEW